MNGSPSDNPWIEGEDLAAVLSSPGNPWALLDQRSHELAQQAVANMTEQGISDEWIKRSLAADGLPVERTRLSAG